MERNSFSQRISKIDGNRKFLRFVVVLKLEFEINPLTPVPAVTGRAKTHPQFPVPAVTGRKKACEDKCLSYPP